VVGTEAESFREPRGRRHVFARDVVKNSNKHNDRNEADDDDDDQQHGHWGCRHCWPRPLRYETYKHILQSI